MDRVEKKPGLIATVGAIAEMVGAKQKAGADDRRPINPQHWIDVLRPLRGLVDHRRDRGPGGGREIKVLSVVV